MEISTKDFADQIRVNALKMVTAAKASHIGSALSIADIVAVLYGKILNTNSDHAEFAKRDRFILSKGHACVAIYVALSKLGFFPEENLKNYGKNYSNLMNHISHKVPGVEFSTGSLGHGLPFGVGKALFSKRQKRDWRVFVLLSDGELDEGSNWEALMFAAHHRLNNLTAIIDYNKLQSLTSIEGTLRLEPLADKFRAFGADVYEVDGHDHDKLLNVFQHQSEAPKVIIAHTIKGKGVSFMENSVLWHYRSPSLEQLAQAIAEINLSARV
jgi:transketolase